jgi:N-acetylmuramoyl-L-alanine amidase
LIELGYLSNPREALLLVDPNHQETICTGIKDAIDTYFDLK